MLTSICVLFLLGTHRHLPSLLHLGSRVMWWGSVQREVERDARDHGVGMQAFLFHCLFISSPLLSSPACSLNRMGQGLRGLRNGQAI